MCHHSEKRTGVTLVEIMVASAIIAFIGGIVGHWFSFSASIRVAFLRLVMPSRQSGRLHGA